MIAPPQDFADRPHGLFEAIVRQVDDAIVFADRDGVIRVWNHGAELLFGFTADQAINHSLDLIVPERFRAAHWAGYRAAMAAGRGRAPGATQGNYLRATRSLHKDGRKLYVELSFCVVTDATAQAIGSVAIGRDITERFRKSTPSGTPA